MKKAFYVAPMIEEYYAIFRNSILSGSGDGLQVGIGGWNEDDDTDYGGEI